MHKKENYPSTEWLVIHHELKGGFRSLIIQHMVEPKFTAEVTEKNSYEMKFDSKLSKDFLSKEQKTVWERKAIVYAKTEIPKQFS
jgi:hypothetical protein